MYVKFTRVKKHFMTSLKIKIYIYIYLYTIYVIYYTFYSGIWNYVHIPVKLFSLQDVYLSKIYIYYEKILIQKSLKMDSMKL